MRAALMLIAVAAFAAGFDQLVTSPSEDVDQSRLAQTGPVPTAAVNPRLETAPAGGHLGSTAGVSPLQPPPPVPQPKANTVDPADVAGGRDATVPGNPAGRLGAIDGNHTGGPTNDAVGAAPMGAVAPPAAGAVEPPPVPKVRPVAPNPGAQP